MLKMSFFIFLFLIVQFIITQCEAQGVTTDLVLDSGYTHEQHFVTTDDGYILKVFRITGSPNCSAAPGKKVVFLMHEFLFSASDWLVLGRDRAFAYLLADECFDVWLGNARGNTYSRAHVDYSPEDAEFWQFSWTEIGIFDLPAMIDLALSKTGQTRLHYIGHGQGNTVFFVMASMLPSYNDKIASMDALAPLVYLDNMFSPLVQLIAFFSRELDVILDALGRHEFNSDRDVVMNSLKKVCQASPLSIELCKIPMFLIYGFDFEQLENHVFLKALDTYPAGAAENQLIHFLQQVRSGRFEEFDFYSGNYFAYGSFSPPDFDLSKVTCPITLYYGPNDWVVSEEDVLELAADLPAAIVREVNFGKFNHLDFVWGKDADEILYYPMIDILKSFP